VFLADPSDSDTAAKVAMASTATLALPQPREAEKGSQIRGKIVDDPAQDTEAQLSVGKEEKAREDEEWLENPVHPRNWPARKKWSNMAIVSRFLPRPSLIARSVSFA
jgi:hypothetical protein